MTAFAEYRPERNGIGLIIGYLGSACTKTFRFMKKTVFLILTITLAATACEKDGFFDFPDDPFGMQGGQQPVTSLKDPGLAWSADSY